MSILDWLRHKDSRGDMQLSFIEAGETFPSLDIKEAIDAHMAWRQRLEDIIHGKSREDLTVGDITADHLCVLGKWIHGTAKAKYSRLSEYRELNQSHAAFHLLAGEVLKEHRRGNGKSAQRLLRVGLRESSERLRLDIARLYGRMTG